MRLAIQKHVWQMARTYCEHGFSVIPCRADKKPSGHWQEWTVRRASPRTIDRWFDDLQLPSIGLVGGRVSDNVVFIDLDGIPAVKMFYEAFPEICENTKSVLTGSLSGIHLYVRCVDIPDNINVRVPNVGGFEIRGNGQYVIAPPSVHPSGNQYTFRRSNSIMIMDNLDHVRDWMESLREANSEQKDAIIAATRPQNVTVRGANRTNYINKIVSDEIAKVQVAPKGLRNTTLYRSALKLSSLSAGGYVVWSEIVARLTIASPLPYGEAIKTIASAYQRGSQNPRVIS